MDAERWKQIKSIFHDATEMADCERATYVLGVYPWVDNLRSDPRFPKLPQRIGLQP